jgi:FlaG/FlaF family flagellin (archaellin)
MSSFIAVLLLMVLSVTAGAVIYSYSMGYFGAISTPTQNPTILSLDSASFNVIDSLSAALTAYIRNIGDTVFVLDSVYVNGIKIAQQDSGTSGWSFEPAAGLDQYEVGKLAISQNPVVEGSNSGAVAVSFKDNTSYEIKVVGKDNSKLSFNVHSGALETSVNALVNSDFEIGLNPWVLEWENMGRTAGYTDFGSQHDGGLGTRAVTDTYIDMLPVPGEAIYSMVYQDFSIPLKISSLSLFDGSLQLWLRNYGPAIDGYDTVEIRVITESGTLSYIFGGTRADPNTVYISLGNMPGVDNWMQVSRNLNSDLVNSGFSTSDSIIRIELRSNGIYDDVHVLRYGQIIRWDDVKLYVKS